MIVPRRPVQSSTRLPYRYWLDTHCSAISTWKPAAAAAAGALRIIVSNQRQQLDNDKRVEFKVTFYFQTSSTDVLLSVSLPHCSCPPCLEYLCPRALFLTSLWRYINHVLTYLLRNCVDFESAFEKPTESRLSLTRVHANKSSRWAE